MKTLIKKTLVVACLFCGLNQTVYGVSTSQPMVKQTVDAEIAQWFYQKIATKGPQVMCEDNGYRQCFQLPYFQSPMKQNICELKSYGTHLDCIDELEHKIKERPTEKELIDYIGGYLNCSALGVAKDAGSSYRVDGDCLTEYGRTLKLDQIIQRLKQH